MEESLCRACTQFLELSNGNGDPALVDEQLILTPDIVQVPILLAEDGPVCKFHWSWSPRRRQSRRFQPSSCWSCRTTRQTSLTAWSGSSLRVPWRCHRSWRPYHRPSSTGQRSTQPDHRT